jgi:tetratricopeptide (TPR) repeat protein
LGRGLELAERRGDRKATAWVTYSLAAAWAYFVDPARTQHYAEQAYRLFEEIGYTLTTYRAHLYIASAHYMRGDNARVVELTQPAYDAAHAYQDGWLEGWAAQLLGRVALHDGDLPRAEHYLTRAHDLRQESGELQNQISDLVWLGRLRLAQGRPADALALTSQAVAMLDALWGEFWVWQMPDVFVAHAEALIACGDEPAAPAYLERAYATLMQFAAQISDPAVRDGLLAHPPYARVITAQETGRLPPL